MDIDKALDEMIKNQEIAKENRTAAKTVLTWLEHGEEEANKVSKKCVENLKKNNLVDNGKIKWNEDNQGFSFMIAVLGADDMVSSGEDAKE